MSTKKSFIGRAFPMPLTFLEKTLNSKCAFSRSHLVPNETIVDYKEDSPPGNMGNNVIS